MRFRFLNSNEPVTTFYRDLAPFLCGAGHEVEIVTSRAEYRYRDLDGALAGTDGLTIRKTYSAFFREFSGSVLAKIAVRILYGIHASFILLAGSRADVNIFLTQPPFFHSLGPIVRWVRGQEYCCVVMDVQPQQYIEFGVLTDGSLAARFLRRVSAFGYRRAALNIVIGRCMADRLVEMGVRRDRIQIIPNWTDEQSYQVVDRDLNRVRSDHNWATSFVVAYGGNIGYAQDFDSFVEAASILRGADAPILFVLIGGGSRADHYQALVEELAIENFQILPFMHEEYELSEIYGAADLAFISLRPSCTGLGVPSKAYNTLAAGRPIVYLGSPEAEISRMIVEEKVGETVTSAADLAASILRYANDPARCLAEGLRAREISETTYSKETAMSAYLSALTSVGLGVGHDGD